MRRRARHTGIGRRRRRECRRADRRRREWGCSRALTPADAAATNGRQPSDEGRRSGAVRAVTGWTTAASRVIARAVYRWWAGRQGDAPLTLVRPLAQQHRAGAEDGHQRSDGQRQADKMLGLAAAETAPLEKEEGDSAPPQGGLKGGGRRESQQLATIMAQRIQAKWRQCIARVTASLIEAGWTGARARRLGSIDAHVRFLQWVWRGRRRLQAAGIRSRMALIVLLRLCRKRKRSRCAGGSNLATDSEFDAMRAFADQMLEWYSVYVQLLRRYSGQQTPTVVQNFCGEGGATEGERCCLSLLSAFACSHSYCPVEVFRAAAPGHDCELCLEPSNRRAHGRVGGALVCVSRPPALCVLLCMCTDGHEVPHGCGCLGCVSGDVVVTCVAPPVRPVVRRRQALCSCGKWAGS